MGENIKCKKIGNTGKKIKIVDICIANFKNYYDFQKVQNRTEKIQKTPKQKLQ